MTTTDLFNEYGDPNVSPALEAAWKAQYEAHAVARELALEEVWRFAPADAQTLILWWTDDPTEPRLSLDEIRDAENVTIADDAIGFDDSEEGILAGRQWDAIDTIVSYLADSWHDADSLLFRGEDGDHFIIERPKEQP